MLTNHRKKNLLLPLAGLLLVGQVSSACQPHAELSAPPATAAATARIDAYEKLRPASYHRSQVTVISRETGVVKESYRTTDFIELADGTKVYYPNDLLPVLHPDSKAARGIRDIDQTSRKAAYIGVGASAVAVTGGVLMVLRLIGRKQGEGLGTVFYLGAGLALLGTAGDFYVENLTSNLYDQTATAYENYDDGLKQHLNLCEHGKEVAPCE